MPWTQDLKSQSNSMSTLTTASLICRCHKRRGPLTDPKYPSQHFRYPTTYLCFWETPRHRNMNCSSANLCRGNRFKSKEEAETSISCFPFKGAPHNSRSSPSLSRYNVRTPERCSGACLSTLPSRVQERALWLPSLLLRTLPHCLAMLPLSLPVPVAEPSLAGPASFRLAIPSALARSVQFPGKEALGFGESLPGR